MKSLTSTLLRATDLAGSAMQPGMRTLNDCLGRGMFEDVAGTTCDELSDVQHKIEHKGE